MFLRPFFYQVTRRTSRACSGKRLQPTHNSATRSSKIYKIIILVNEVLIYLPNLCGQKTPQLQTMKTQYSAKCTGIGKRYRSYQKRGKRYQIRALAGYMNGRYAGPERHKSSRYTNARSQRNDTTYLDTDQKRTTKKRENITQKLG